MPEHAVHVRLRSDLPRDEIDRVMRERAYRTGPGDREYGDFHLSRSRDDATAYGCIDQPDITVHEVVMPLRD